MATGKVPTGHGNGLHRTQDVQFREDDCRMRTGNAPTVMDILRRVSLNMLRTSNESLKRMCPSGCCATASDANPGS